MSLAADSLAAVAASGPLGAGAFGRRLHVEDAHAFIAAAEQMPRAMPEALNAGHGLLLLRGLGAIADDPGLLLRLSALFGPEVEDYRPARLETKFIHPRVPQILVVTNRPPHDRRAPPQPDPPRLADGGLPVTFPHRTGWHTDQSFRRPPPDISLFHAVVAAPPGQGQTLYADGTAAWDSLPPALKARVENLVGIHVIDNAGRSESAVRAGRSPRPLGPHEQPQRQPVARIHPETGRRALYLCDGDQMDWLTGPFEGMEPGPDGDGARLLRELMAHYTQPAFVHVQEWQTGDLVVYDNRCVIHCATWFDAAAHDRVMWRTTVWGNPGSDYAGEARSWEAT